MGDSNQQTQNQGKALGPMKNWEISEHLDVLS